MNRRLLTAALALPLAALGAGCGGDRASAPPTPATSLVEGCTVAPPPRTAARATYDAEPPMTVDAAATYTATMATSCGTLTIALDPAAAPHTVNSFVFLARKGFFDGLAFHRILPDFVAQGGAPNGDPNGGPGYEFADELPSVPYRVGDIAMANAGPGTNGSQFFLITGARGAALPPDYSLFGHVTKGMDVLARLNAVADPTASSGTPIQPTYIDSVTIAVK